MTLASQALVNEIIACFRLWSMERPAAQDFEALNKHEEATNRLGQKVAAVLKLEEIYAQGEHLANVTAKGAVMPPHDVDPTSTRKAMLAMEAARDNAEVGTGGVA